jgi:hypothetical protein
MYESLIEAIEQAMERKLSEINTNMPGTIVSYDAPKNRAVVKVTLPKALDDDEALPGPQIVEVPVVWSASGGGSSSFTMPLQPGDGVMLAVQQRSLENWLGGNNDAPDDPRQFDLSDCVAIPGCSHNGTVAHSEDVVLKFNKTEVRLKPDGTIVLGNDKGGITIDGSGNMTLKAQSIHVDTAAKAFTLETHKHDKVQTGGALSGEPFPT